MGDNERYELLLTLAHLQPDVHGKVIALRTLLIRLGLISQEELDEMLTQLKAGAPSRTAEDLDPQLLELLRGFEGLTQ